MTTLNTATTLDYGLEGWIINTARKHYWRVARWLELEDLIQDGRTIWAKCRLVYTHIRQREHFVALVKTSFFRHIVDLARQRTLESCESVFSDCADIEALPNWIERVAPCCYIESLDHVIKDARYPVNAVLRLFFTENGSRTMELSPQRSDEQYVTYVCRLIGIDRRVFDIPALLESYLLGRGIYFLSRPSKLGLVLA